MAEPEHYAKRCPHCGQTKGAVEFYRDSSSTDGLSSYCRPCATERSSLRTKALVVLKNRHPEEFRMILEEMMDAAQAAHEGGE